ncbi:MAG: hypothetical protein IJP61_00820 [Treponema sp.]|nr:hypothetical protein [Treponema sp.]
MTFRKSFILLLIIGFASFSLNAKDSVGIGIQIGAIGSEKTYYSSSYISSDTISMPYTKTTFNPDVHIGMSLSIFDINEISIFGLDLGYDCSWDYSYSNSASYERESYIIYHKISLIPEITFSKSNFRFLIGTGIALGIEPYKYESVLSGSKYTNDYTDFKVLWVIETGAKYKLGNNLFAVAGIDLFVTMFDFYKTDDYKMKSSGSSAMEILPKMGVMYCF